MFPDRKKEDETQKHISKCLMFTSVKLIICALTSSIFPLPFCCILSQNYSHEFMSTIVLIQGLLPRESYFPFSSSLTRTPLFFIDSYSSHSTDLFLCLPSHGSSLTYTINGNVFLLSRDHYHNEL